MIVNAIADDEIIAALNVCMGRHFTVTLKHNGCNKMYSDFFALFVREVGRSRILM